MNDFPLLHNQHVTETRRKAVGAIAASGLFVAGLAVLYAKLHTFDYHELGGDLAAMPRRSVALALALTLVNYLVLAAYDVLAVRNIKARLHPVRAGLAAFIAYSINNSAGFSGVFGGGIRLRLYRAWGLSPADVAKIIAFTVGTFWIGFVTLAGLSFTLSPPEIWSRPLLFRVGGAFLLLLPLGYILLAAQRRTVTFRRREIALPSLRVAVAQVVLSAMDWLLAVGVLYVLLPDGWSFVRFSSAFLLAQGAGLASGLPGGIGVFETIVVLLLAPAYGVQPVVAALLVYRGVYYLAPLAIACVLLVGYELHQRRHMVRRAAGRATQAVGYLTPWAMSAATFVAGVVLLLSGATPPVHHRFTLMERAIGLPIMEVSHLLASIAGAALLFLARGLQRRLNGAFWLAALLLGAGSVMSLLKGFDYEEALLLTFVLVLLVAARRHFYRPTLLIDEPFSAGWIAAIVIVVATSIWLGLFSYKHVEYSSELWLRFSGAHGSAPRFLRSSVGVIALLMLFSLRKLLRPPDALPDPPATADLDTAHAIALRSRGTEAWLALTADKQLLFDSSREAFLMYGISGRSWIAMGDPAGEPVKARELAWKFRELCDRHRSWPVFYEISNAMLPVVVELGLTIFKVGEAARVDLSTFTMDGGAMKALRKTLRRFDSEGWTVEVVAPGEVPPLLPVLRSISDEWLDAKNTREKRFSLGWFDDDYLSRCPVAVARHNGEIVAFTNLWDSEMREELSVDLMRHRADAPSGIMDYLFLQLIHLARDKGYRWFSLGMAPLSGLEARSLGPLWNRVGALVFFHGEHFYNFQGLRQYKQKFSPAWEPRYIAIPRGSTLPRVLANVATLVAGGVRGVVSK